MSMQELENDLFSFFQRNGFRVEKRKRQRNKIKFTQYALVQNDEVIYADSIGKLFDHYRSYLMWVIRGMQYE